MEFLNIGGLELLFILVVALVALGPERIVKVGHALGQFLRKLSKNVLFREVVQTTDEIRNYPRKILDEAKLDLVDLDLHKKIQQEMGHFDQEEDVVRTSARDDMPAQKEDGQAEQSNNALNLPKGP